MIQRKRSIWQQEASCRSKIDDKTYFPGKGRREKDQELPCTFCKVALECLRFAIVHDEMGIWAATSQRQRRKIPNRWELVRQAKDEGWYEPPHPSPVRSANLTPKTPLLLFDLDEFLLILDKETLAS